MTRHGAMWGRVWWKWARYHRGRGALVSLGPASPPFLALLWLPPRSPLSGEGEAARRGSKPERKGGHLATENPKPKQAQT